MKPIGHTILRFEELPSTNTLLMEDAAHLENHGLVAIAHHQTAGRGRFGRRWVSNPARQLQFSVVLHPPLPRERVAVVSLVIGLAVGRFLQAGLALRPRLKWPNDVFLNDKKVCGILVEMKQGRGGAPRLVVGIGLNCLGSPAEFPEELRGLITTLAHERGGEVELESVFQGVLAELQTAFQKLTLEELPALLESWEAMADLKGRRVRFPDSESQPELKNRDGATGITMREGVALGLTPEGYLLIEKAGGGHHVHLSGDLEWVD